MMWRKALVIVVMGLLLGAGAALLVEGRHLSETRTDKMARLDVGIGSSAVVEARVVSVGEPARIPESDFAMYVDRVAIDRVLFVADGPALVAGGRFDVPKPPLGEVVMTELAGDVTGVHGGSRIPSLFESVEPGEPVILLLGYRPVVEGRAETRKPPAAQSSPWFIGAAAQLRDGRLVFLGPDGGWMTEQFAWVVEPGEDPVDVLVAWVAERDAAKLGAGPGPISKRFADAWRQRHPTREDLWRNTPPEHRILDPEETPPDVFATLVETNVVVDVDPAARRDAVYLVVRTPLGLMHSARLTEGSHPAPVFSLPDSPWEIVVARDEWGEDGVVVATVAPEVWEGAVGVMLHIPPEAVAALDDPSLAPVDGIIERFDDVHQWISAVDKALRTENVTG